MGYATKSAKHSYAAQSPDTQHTPTRHLFKHLFKEGELKGLIVLSLGGSIIVPEKIDTVFLKKFRNFILRNVKRGRRFVIICGGGRTARNYIAAASEIKKVSAVDLDWIGIYATRLNAALIKSILKNVAFDDIPEDPTMKVKEANDAKVIIAAGWKPGKSTDYDAVLLARTYGATIVVNLTDVDYVYDKNPKKHPDARPIKEMSWDYFRKIIGDKWTPGLSAPFDPVAAKLAEKLKLTVFILNGRNLENLDKCLEGKPFIGTIIH